MNFDLDKCTYMYVERGRRKYRNEEIEVNGIRIKEPKENDVIDTWGLMKPLDTKVN